MRVLICGSRDWTDRAMIERVMQGLGPGPHTIIHGRAKGADTIAATIALRLGYAIDKPPTTTDSRDPEHLGGYPVRDVDWRRFGKRAGHMRNHDMLYEGHPDFVVAFHLGGSRGTQDMINQAKLAGVRTETYTASTVELV